MQLNNSIISQPYRYNHPPEKHPVFMRHSLNALFLFVMKGRAKMKLRRPTARRLVCQAQRGASAIQPRNPKVARRDYVAIANAQPAALRLRQPSDPP
jgi:hypothetical protein